jgi:hypothetical protein
LTGLLYIDILWKELVKLGVLLQVNLQKMCKRLPQLPYCGGLPHLSRTSYQQWLMVRCLTPDFKLVVDVSFVIRHTLLCFIDAKIQNQTLYRAKIGRFLIKVRSKIIKNQIKVKPKSPTKHIKVRPKRVLGETQAANGHSIL